MSSITSSSPAGHVVSGSGNIGNALAVICNSNNSLNNVLAYLTQLMATISNLSANFTTAFNNAQNQAQSGSINVNGTDYLWMLSNVTASNFGGDQGQYSAWVSKTQSLYQAASSQNQATTKGMDTDSSEVQNTTSTIPQTQQNNIQAMGTIVSWTQNLAKLLSD